jgi:hypothetical protein
MIKMLKRALGREVGDGRLPNQGLVGRVDLAPAGNSILEIGSLNTDGSWTKVQDGGHIALTPGEREELIEALESHRDVKVIEVSDVIGTGYTVLAAQYLNATADSGELRGTLLTWHDSKREYGIFTAFANGAVEYGSFPKDSQGALNAYATRIVEHLYPHFNASPPTLTFAAVAERDKLKADS